MASAGSVRFTRSVLSASMTPERLKASPPLGGLSTSQTPHRAAFVVPYGARQPKVRRKQSETGGKKMREMT